MTLLSRGGTIYFLGPDPADILQTFELHKIQGMATSPYGLGRRPGPRTGVLPSAGTTATTGGRLWPQVTGLAVQFLA
jgi:hypothetical protein